MKREKPLFRGAACAVITPFNTDGAVDFGALRDLVERQIAAGSDALVVLGTTGECATLTDAERARCITAAVHTAAGRVPVIAGAGSNNTVRAVFGSKLAQDAGADALLHLTPYYNKATDEGLQRHFFAAADAVSLPIMIYHVPARTGLSVRVDAFAALAQHPNITSVKEASGNLSFAAALLARCGSLLDIYAGCDDTAVAYLSLGACGVVSVLSNLEPAAVHAMCTAFFRGDTVQAARMQTSAMPLIHKLFAQVNPVPVKCLMAKRGLCENILRLPLTAIEEKDLEPPPR